ncbi:hypothetical protein RCL1_000524 [Eukaryota sp. TZLM3-RCL]
MVGKTKHRRHPKKLTITNPVLKKLYDPKQTMKQNLTRLGLQFHPERIAHKPSQARDIAEASMISPPQEVVEHILTAPPPAAAHKLMPEGDRIFIEDLLAKHRLDFNAMFRDISLNQYQHTAAVLRKKVLKYIEIFPDRAKERNIPTDISLIPTIDD